jgi:hypothetical protein
MMGAASWWSTPALSLIQSLGYTLTQLSPACTCGGGRGQGGEAKQGMGAWGGWDT